MRDFSELYRALDRTTKTNKKVAAMVEYFVRAQAEDAAWAVYFLTGNKISRAISAKQIREWATSEANIPLWLFEESYTIVGDLAETLSLIVDIHFDPADRTLAETVASIRELAVMSESEKLSTLSLLWRQLNQAQRFLFAKLITGSMRIGVSRGLVTRALSEAFQLDREVVAHRLMGKFSPTAADFRRLIDPSTEKEHVSKPYPFCLANPVHDRPHELLQLDDTLAEWKWDGIRAQLIRREGQVFIWSRGEDRIEDRFPELTAIATGLPDGIVLDGEVLGWKDGRPLPFLSLQRRINRKSVGKKLLSEVPVVFQAFDLIEELGRDLRTAPLSFRRSQLEALLQHASNIAPLIRLSPRVEVSNWEQLTALRQTAREVGTEGLMLKSLRSQYATGRTVGHWWKWKVEPLTIDAVLIYAQRGHGRRATLYTDYTFALWHEGALVPFAKAYSGLTDSELREVDRFVRKNTLERFGPVRSVQPELVMELAFENIQRSNRHKSGVAVRFPRILRWRHDKPASEANSLADLQALAESVYS